MSHLLNVKLFYTFMLYQALSFHYTIIKVKDAETFIGSKKTEQDRK